jgi:uncharacterized membrane protein (DUF485 family)
MNETLDSIFPLFHKKKVVFTHFLSFFFLLHYQIFVLLNELATNSVSVLKDAFNLLSEKYGR